MRLQRLQASLDDLRAENGPVGVLLIFPGDCEEGWAARYNAPDGTYILASSGVFTLADGRRRIEYLVGTEAGKRSTFRTYTRKGNALIAIEAFARAHRKVDSALHCE